MNVITDMHQREARCITGTSHRALAVRQFPFG